MRYSKKKNNLCSSSMFRVIFVETERTRKVMIAFKKALERQELFESRSIRRDE